LSEYHSSQPEVEGKQNACGSSYSKSYGDM